MAWDWDRCHACSAIPDSALIRIEPPHPAIAREIWLLAHPDLRSATRILEFMRVVGDAFEKDEDLLLGRAANGVDLASI